MLFRSIRGIPADIAAPAAITLVGSALLLSLLVRRSFCSWVCPVGTVSEWLWKLGFSRTGRFISPPEAADRYLRLLKYLLLLLLMVVAFTWSEENIRWYLGGQGRAAGDVALFSFFRHPSWGFLIVVLLIALSVRLRNPFCRYLCPYGAMLAVVALASPVAVQRHKGRCVSCGVCSTVCPSRIDVAKADRVNSAECVGCCRCVSHCRVHSALSMKGFGRITVPGIIYAALVLVIFFGGIQLGKVSGYWKSRIGVGDYTKVRL